MVSEQLAIRFKYPLIHRLDKGTSGILMLAKKEQFRQDMIKIFKNREISKSYIAIVGGRIIEPLSIHEPILTTHKNNRAHSFIHPKGKEANTVISPLESFKNVSKIGIQIDTGRTHQIRLHLQSIHHYILGDDQYGGKPYRRLMLHHAEVKFLKYHFVSPDPFNDQF